MAKKSMIAKQKRTPKFGVQAYNRCKSCGRPKGFMRKFQLCRICFRNLALLGEVMSRAPIVRAFSGAVEAGVKRLKRSRPRPMKYSLVKLNDINKGVIE